MKTLIMPDTDVTFRPNSMDFHTYANVLMNNEYHLPDRFKKDDIIFDVGANIGFFALACLARGAGFVECWEADPDNFRYLARNLKLYQRFSKQYRGIVLHKEMAVDFCSENKFHTSGHRVNFDTAGDLHRTTPGRRKSIPIDRILPNEPFRLLKMDIEGSEWPILYESKNLVHAKEILVECHQTLPYKGYKCTFPCAIERLEQLRFKVEAWRESEQSVANMLIKATNRRRL